MINIQQDSNINNLNGIMDKHGSIKLKIKHELLKMDKNALRSELDMLELMGSTGKREDMLKRNIKILDELDKSIKEDVIDIRWYLDSGVVKASTLEVGELTSIGLDIMKYIDKNNSKLVYLDYRKLADIISVELMYRDIGESNSTVEDKLKDAGIIGVNNLEQLECLIGEEPYKLSKVLRVSSSPYIVHCNKTIIDYFGKKEFSLGYYKEVVSHSCKSAMAIILESIMRELASKNIKFGLCSLMDTGLVLMVDNEVSDETINSLNVEVVIRVFGRRFVIRPTINMI